jgi:coenzyme F420 hydrogenase subunit beta
MGRYKFKTVKGIVDSQLCLGCGACAYICPQEKIDLVEVVSEGHRPRLPNEDCAGCRDCLDVCPAFDNDHRHLLDRPGLILEVKSAYGPVLEVWEGHASDPEIRFMGSSGGLLTALSLFSIERERMHGVLHISADPQEPIRNRTSLSRTREALLAATGSRYSPASACDCLQLIENAPEPCLFVGQPSEITALRKAERLRPALHRNVALALSFFCAGSPAILGTRELLRAEGIDVDDVEEVRYRGIGWPGWFGVRRRGSPAFTPLRPYADSWGFLQRYRPMSVNLTPDGSGEEADISCGDPWYRPIGANEAGSSLILVRTEVGRQLLRKAREAGYVQIEPRDASVALQSQANLIRKRGAVWGRVLTLRLLGLPAPHLRGFSMFENWLRLSLLEKIQSTAGTARRVLRRRLLRLCGKRHAKGAPRIQNQVD